VINSSDPVISYINTTGHELFKGTVHNFTGDTTYLNSGLIWAGGVIPDGFPKVNSFIVTFMKPGTYHYQCLIYPEMRETITVKPLT
jgi:plastocyanin